MKKSILMSALLLGGLVAASPKITATTLPTTLEQSQQENVKIDAEQLPEAVKNSISADESVATLSIAEAWQMTVPESKFHFKVIFDNGTEEKLSKIYDEAGNEIKE
jgi:antitoxin component YwqK of YwqJK toxin-antitoxin module